MAALQQAQKKLSYQRIIEFVCRAIVACSEEEAMSQQILKHLPEVWQERGKFRAESTAARALHLILGMPVITVKLLADELGVTLAAANQGVKHFGRELQLHELIGEVVPGYNCSLVGAAVRFE